jgi:CRISPR-associated protein Csd1
MPICHTLQNAHINIVIDGVGNFKRASVLEKPKVVLPATEKSAGRSRGEAPHPLADKIQYLAKDYSDFGGKKKSYFSSYEALLSEWINSPYSHPKATAVHNYINKGHVVKDLINCKIMFVDHNNKLLAVWPDVFEDICPTPKIFKVLPPLEKKKRVIKDAPEIEQGDALVCWTVEVDGESDSNTWQDESLQQSWIDYDTRAGEDVGFCFVTGEENAIAVSHPARLRHTGDKAKLISANDYSGFTFRGRFTDKKGQQASSISFDVTQKAHNALRWLINRQGFRNNEQVYICWAVSGKKTPDPLRPTFDFFQTELQLQEEQKQKQEPTVEHSVNLGASFAVKLKKYLAGYYANLEPNEQIIVMGLDSATPGRMGVIYYRQLLASEFLQRLEAWHTQFAWPQRHTIEIPDPSGKKKAVKKTISTVSCPAPRMIAEAAYGNILKSNETLKKSVIERILPCIIDGRPFPRDIVESAVRRAGNRQTKRLSEQYSNFKSEKSAWEKHLGVACALYKGYYLRHPMENERRKYIMALEENRTTRDYLYGRLLAIAERIEEMAMLIAEEKPRTTVASRLMQRFSDNPFSTWLNIEKGIVPYQERLKNNIAPLAEGYKRLLDDVCDAFKIEEFKSKDHLSGEYLLGFHSQRKWFREHKLDKGKWILKDQGNNNLDITKGEQS